jgi:hypothetical protein
LAMVLTRIARTIGRWRLPLPPIISHVGWASAHADNSGVLDRSSMG